MVLQQHSSRHGNLLRLAPGKRCRSWVDFTDEKGNHWQRTTDGLGRLTEVMEPDGVNQTASLETDYSYDVLDNLISVNQKGKVGTDTPRPTRTFTYDSLSRLTQAYNPESGWVCYGTTGGAAANGSNCTSGYDANGNVSSKTDARGVTISNTYDALNRILSKSYSNNTTPPASYIYDTSSISGAANVVGRLTSESVMSGSTLIAWRAPYKYDAMGRLQNEQQCTPANCSGTAYSPAYTYDLAGSLATASPGLPSTISGLPGTAMQFSYTYDGAERLRIVTSNIAENQNHPSILFQANAYPSYGPMGLMSALYGINSSTNLSAITLARTYDKRGHLLSETDVATQQANPSTGTITVSGTEQSGTPGSGTISITGIVPGPASGNFTITIGTVSRPVYWSESPSGITASTLAGMIASAFAGNTFVSVTAVNGGVHVTSYLAGSGSNYHISITQPSPPKVTFSAPSALSGGTTPGTTYDAGTAYAIINGNTATVSWGQGSTAANIASALASAIGTADSSFITTTVSSNVISLTSIERGTGSNWSITTGVTNNSTAFASSSFSLSSSGMTGGGGGNIYSYSIPSSGGFDAAGNVTSVTDLATGQWSYTYDTLNRLLTGSATSGSYSGNKGCWAYDSFGNRTAENFHTTACPTPETQEAATEPTARYSVNNQVTWTSVNGAASGLTYDAAGNVLNDNANAYLYDAENRLCAVKNLTTSQVTAYVYDAAGVRVGKGTLSSWPSACVAPTSVNGFTLTNSYVLGPGGEQVSELSISGSTATWAHTNISANGQLLASYHDTNTYFDLNDWMGTKRASYTPNGLLSTYFSLPYGNGLSSSGNASDATEHHFTGKERDSESGLDNFKARYFGSSMGRFMSPDPAHIMKQKLVDPQQWNMYAYVRNNPLRFFDPTGKYLELTGDDAARKKQLEALQKAAGKAGSYLYDNTDNGKHYVGIYTNGQDGKGPSFGSINAVSNKLSGIIGDTKAGADIQFVSPGTKIMGTSIGSGDKGMSPAGTMAIPGVAHIYLTSGDLGHVPGNLMGNGKPSEATLGEVLVHELGHVDSVWYHGGQDRNGDAVRIEDQVRQTEGAPMRIGHTDPYDVNLSPLISY